MKTSPAGIAAAPRIEHVAASRNRGWHELAQRLQGPGGYYNLGNVFVLATGLGLQLGQASHSTSLGAAVADFFIGNVSSVALTIATVIFILSGEAYHRAWANGFPPDRSLNRSGDVLSGVGAMAMGVGLLLLGHPILALTSGVLHALGKFGSAGYAKGKSWSLAFRAIVLASRFPAMFAASYELLNAMGGVLHGASAAPALASASLLISYTLWVKADLLLFKG